MNAQKLFDSYKRHIHKLRLQVTDACNFRCFYCMPLNVKFLPKASLLSAEELFYICTHLAHNGIDEIRVSGGEPLLRPDFNKIIKGLSQLPLKRLGVTTNGFYLEEKIDFLKTTKCRYINISLDTLNVAKFQNITQSSFFERVYNAIIIAKQEGFHVKTNTVIMRGVNDDEILDFLEFARKQGVEVRFLELMKIGCARNNHDRQFISAREIIEEIERCHQLTPLSVNADSTALNFLTDHGAKIGFITSESQSFCDFCSRLRLTADGYLRACLMSQAGVSLKEVPVDDYPRLINQVLRLKPRRRIEQIEQPMYQIGG